MAGSIPAIGSNFNPKLINTMKDLENSTYNQLQAYLIEKLGKNAVTINTDLQIIEVNMVNIYLCINLSSNETKMYFQSVPAKIVQELEYSDWKTVKSFRVFSFELAKQYIDFKIQENELIKSIEG